MTTKESIKIKVYRIATNLLAPLKGLGLRRFKIVRKGLSLIKSRSANVRGHLMYLNTLDFTMYEPLITNTFESYETEIVLGMIKKDDVVMDLGANIGYYTLLIAQKIGPQGQIWAFEQEPRNFKLLKKNIAVNGYTNTTLSSYALSDHKGESTLYSNTYNKGDNRIFPSRGFETMPIKLETLDSVLPTSMHGKVNFIKMDIQGAECLALRGMTSILDKSKNLKMAMEFWPQKLLRAGTSAGEVIDILERNKFTYSIIDESQKKLIPVNRNELLSSIPENDADSAVNLLCVRNR